MNKKYTVFLSSTYDDLREERNAVIQALLEMDCFPCSMEYFPSDDDEQFEFIKSIIDECDYYILIIAGRYGSIGKNGKSYTEMEYQYAIEKGIPIAIFIHDDIDSISLNKSEKNEQNRKKLDSFIKKISKNKMCKFWNGKEDLAGKVSRAMSSMIKRHPAVGWVRGNYVLNDDMMIKMQNLYAENILYKEKEQLENKKNLYKKGKDVTNVVFNILEKDFYLNILRREIIEFSWDELFKVWGQVFLEENRSYNLKSRIANNAIENGMITTGDTEEAMLSDESFEKVSVQFMALGLLEVVHPNHDNDYDMSQESRFRVTKAGEKYLIDLLAEKK